MKPHEVLQQFSGHPKFNEIREAYVSLINSGTSSAELLRILSALYPLHTMRETGAPVTVIYPDNQYFEGGALDQLYTASKIPPALKGALLPDGHPGYALPIGGVIALHNAISPSFVGYDISCKMHLSVFDCSVEEFMKLREALFATLVKVTSFGLGAKFKLGEREHPVMEHQYWGEISLLKKLKALAQAQLGSSGGGNHFADLMILTENGRSMPALLTHSGSRGTGHKVATHYVGLAEQQTRVSTKKVPKEYSWLSLDSEAGCEYEKAMELMGLYADANHLLIHEHFIKESGLGKLGHYSNKHNFAWRETIEIDGQKVEAIVHRKGATPAHKGKWGVIPGTCGTTSYLVRGLGYADTMNSASHGAGRPRSRTASKKGHDQKAFLTYMTKKNILHHGIEGDETPLAYKDIETVIKPQEGTIFKTIATLEPVAVVMGGKSDDGD